MSLRVYSDKIALVRNSRGVYSLDTVMGCSGGMTGNKNGCYGECYAAKYARRYGYDFSKYVLRKFTDSVHLKNVKKDICAAEMGFIRIGTSGDPSEDWGHTLSILEEVAPIDKEFVIITKHWKNIKDSALKRIKALNLTINTSVSALDDEKVLANSLAQHEKLKQYCNSVLRVVTCEFNTFNPVGWRLDGVQEDLVKIDNSFIDTTFRVSKSNPLVKGNVINTKEVKFLGGKCLVSKFNKKTFFGRCDTCPELCGAKSKPKKSKFKKPKQLEIFLAGV